MGKGRYFVFFVNKKIRRISKGIAISKLKKNTSKRINPLTYKRFCLWSCDSNRTPLEHIATTLTATTSRYWHYQKQISVQFNSHNTLLNMYLFLNKIATMCNMAASTRHLRLGKATYGHEWANPWLRLFCLLLV